MKITKEIYNLKESGETICNSLQLPEIEKHLQRWEIPYRVIKLGKNKYLVEQLET